MAIDWRRAVVLSTAEFDVVWELLGLGDLPVVLELRAAGRTWAERDRIVVDALRTLADRGLVHGSRPHPALASDLAVLAAPDSVHDLVIGRPVPYSAFAATAGPSCVLAVRLDDRVVLVRVPPDRAAAELVGLIGPVHPGPGPAVRLPARAMQDALAAGEGDPERFAAALLRQGVDGPDVAAVLRMTELTGGGELGGEWRTEAGLRRAPYALRLHVTAHGCYRQRRVPGDGSEPVVEAGPVDSAALVRELEDLVRPAPAR